jgi:hypothetical protein
MPCRADVGAVQRCAVETGRVVDVLCPVVVVRDSPLGRCARRFPALDNGIVLYNH